MKWVHPFVILNLCVVKCVPHTFEIGGGKVPGSIMNVPLKQFPNQLNFNQAKHLSISSCSSPTEVCHECCA
jgi:hypothetical protein